MMDTVVPLTVAVTHPLASMFVSARSVPLLFVTVTLLVADAAVKLNAVALTLIFGVGVFVGLGVGVFVGFLVGVGVGFFVGVFVGFFVGVFVGFFVGVGVFTFADCLIVSLTD